MLIATIATACGRPTTVKAPQMAGAVIRLWQEENNVTLACGIMASVTSNALTYILISSQEPSPALRIASLIPACALSAPGLSAVTVS
jgi:hypothetical protein